MAKLFANSGDPDQGLHSVMSDLGLHYLLINLLWVSRLNWIINSFPASGDFCCLLVTFANSLNPDQAGKNVGPDLDPNCLTLMVFLKDFF